MEKLRSYQSSINIFVFYGLIYMYLYEIYRLLRLIAFLIDIEFEEISGNTIGSTRYYF